MLQKSRNPQILVRPAEVRGEHFDHVFSSFFKFGICVVLFVYSCESFSMFSDVFHFVSNDFSAGQPLRVALRSACLAGGYALQQGLLPWQSGLSSRVSPRPTSHFDDDAQWTIGDRKAALPQHDRLSSRELEPCLVC